jgi:hypothetical protein
MIKAHDIVIVDNMSEHEVKALKKVLHDRVSKLKLTQVDWEYVVLWVIVKMFTVLAQICSWNWSAYSRILMSIAYENLTETVT